jgi:phage shock protein A
MTMSAVSSTRPRGAVGRFFNYVSASLGLWVRDREQRNPRAVYEQAIQGRLQRYAELKEAVAGILYLRNKLEAEIRDRRAEIARLGADAERAVKRADESLAVAIVTHRHELVEDLARAEQELEGLRTEADAAKENLLHFREEIRALEREKGRALAVFAGARMRRQVRAAIDGLSVDADVRALEGVREYVAKLATEAHLDGELGRGSDLRHRLAEIRGEARHEAARREVEEIKRRVRPALASPTEATPTAANGSPAQRAEPTTSIPAS